MGKGFAITSLVVAIVLVLLFGADLAIGLPFHQASQTMDYGFLVSGAILSFISFRSFREQR